ncbi:hypothetical protein H5U98_08885 [Mycolicibacterium boenickei]|uniref:Uncharacterized protein n=1 Tax=Mycolicibacterium boenickei TaxID=146017 RepID=A0AAX3A1B3_9MYCO|nr:hypothetical protein [Mycolicibacterium boenickei]UNC01473.1 hypothetical protein H5U98_08885 [Mycolicibacterium boenickei]BBX91361.1 hypothetical protein MBOE_30100 [Mycolicibacterium boenickei]
MDITPAQPKVRRRQKDWWQAPRPMLPNLYQPNGDVDMIDSSDRESELQRLIFYGEVSVDEFVVGECTDADKAHNLAVFERAQRQLDAKRAQRARLSNDPSDAEKRARATGMLKWTEGYLGRLTDLRDDETNTQLFKLAVFHNDGLLSEQEIADAVLRASTRNGHLKQRGQPRTGPGHGNKTRAQISADVRRAISKARQQGQHVDWDRLGDGKGARQPQVAEVAAETLGGTSRAKAETNGQATKSENREEPITPVYSAVILKRSDLQGLPDPIPLIDNVLDQGTIALLYGKWGTLQNLHRARLGGVCGHRQPMAGP